MANASNVIAPAGSVAVLRAVDFFFNLRSNFADWNEARITRKALSELSDDQLVTLDDISGSVKAVLTQGGFSFVRGWRADPPRKKAPPSGRAFFYFISGWQIRWIRQSSF